MEYKNLYLKYKFKGGIELYNEDVHNQLLNKWMKYYIGTKSPTVILRIGTMGSGKTSAVNSFIDNYLGYNSNLFSIIDLDKIIVTSGYMNSPDDWWNAQVTINGYKIVEDIINESILLKRHLSTESTGKFLCPSKKIIRKAMHNGYNIIGICPFVPYFIIKGRIIKRAEEEGRNVSLDELSSNVINMLPKLLDIAVECDIFYVLDNTVSYNETPKILTEINYSAKSYDDKKCCEWKINTVTINNLISLLYDNINKYDNNEQYIYNIELTFLKKLIELQ